MRRAVWAARCRGPHFIDCATNEGMAPGLRHGDRDLAIPSAVGIPAPHARADGWQGDKFPEHDGKRLPSQVACEEPRARVRKGIRRRSGRFRPLVVGASQRPGRAVEKGVCATGTLRASRPLTWCCGGVLSPKAGATRWSALWLRDRAACTSAAVTTALIEASLLGHSFSTGVCLRWCGCSGRVLRIPQRSRPDAVGPRFCSRGYGEDHDYF